MAAPTFLVPFYYSRLCCFLVVLTLCQGYLSVKKPGNILCIEKERVALLHFKHDLANSVNRLKTWGGKEDDCCIWGGIVCNNVTGHVHEIHLRGPDYHDYYTQDSSEFSSYLKHRQYVKDRDEKMKREKLGGKISPSLLNLEQLEFLDLSLNDFGGLPLPSFIGSLHNLRHLNVSEAQFSTEIPHQLGNLSRLQVLSLERIHSDDKSESAKSLQWLSGLPMLQRLYLSEVDLSGVFDWLQVINSLPSLKELHLSGCNLPQIPPDHLTVANLTSLSVLDLSDNDLGTSPNIRAWIFSMHHLVSLDVTDSGNYDLVSGKGVGISNLTSLRMLSVSGNDFVNSSLAMKELSSLGGSLVSLKMHGCEVSSRSLADLHNMTSLVNLELSSNDLSETIQSSFGDFCNLKHIDLSYNDFIGLSLSGVLKSLFECTSPKLESLNIMMSNISGHLPYQLGQMKHLVDLQLAYNSISGPLPDSFQASSSSLKVLNLKDNLIFGMIPSSIGVLSSLALLDLSSNRLSGPIPHSVGRLLSLEKLDISRNNLNGSVPTSIGHLWRLNHLDIAENLLTGIITQDHIGNLTRLKRFRADYNNLSITSDWVPPSQLQVLGLNSVSLGPRFPLWLQWQKSLYYLDIANTRISDSMPSWFWSRLSGLTYLNVSFNQMQLNLSRIPASLEVLDANSINFGGPLPELSDGSQIMYLDLSNNMFSGSLTRLLCHGVRTGENLFFLNLGYNNLSGVIPGCWDQWRELLFLNLESNNLSGRIPSSLGSTNLLFLNMGKNKLSGQLPYSLTNLKILMILLLAENDLDGTIPTWIGTKLQDLRILKLRSNNISGELCLLTSVQILDLALNNLSGHIPACFSNFSALTQKEEPLANDIPLYDLPYGVPVRATALLMLKGREDSYNSILALVALLDLSSNYFSGHIPVEITSLVSLQSLNLSRNLLAGSIPASVGDMKLLESLDLSMNQLSGEIPTTVSSLSFLSHLNVSYNGLTGRIPLSTQLQSLDNSSFIGNKLCGPPLTSRCGFSSQGEGDGGGDRVEEDTSRPDWGFVISILSGFALGFWVVLAPLIVTRSWRIIFFGFMDKVRYGIYDVTRNLCCIVFRK